VYPCSAPWNQCTMAYPGVRFSGGSPDRHQIGIYVFPYKDGNIENNFLVFIISGFVFIFVYNVNALPRVEPGGKIELVHHPNIIQIITETCTKEVHFGWPEGKDIYVNMRKVEK
jgi:hypothetical protein